MTTPDFEGRAREIALDPSWNFPDHGGLTIQHGVLAHLISSALSVAFEMGMKQGKSPDGDRALVNQAPAGLGPSGVDRFCEVGVWTSEMKAAAMQDAQNVCDLSVLVVRFIRRVQKGLPLAELAVQADDFLKRKGLYGSPLRERDRNPKGGNLLGSVEDESPVPEGNSPNTPSVGLTTKGTE